MVTSYLMPQGPQVITQLLDVPNGISVQKFAFKDNFFNQGE